MGKIGNAREKTKEFVEKGFDAVEKVTKTAKTAANMIKDKIQTNIPKKSGIVTTNAVNKKDFYLGNKGFLYTIELLVMLFTMIGIVVASIFLGIKADAQSGWVNSSNVKIIDVVLWTILSINIAILCLTIVVYYIHKTKVDSAKLSNEIEVFSVSFKKGQMKLVSQERTITIGVDSISSITQEDKWNAKDYFETLPMLPVQATTYSDELSPQKRSSVKLYSYPVEISTIEGHSFSVQPLSNKYIDVVKKVIGFVG